VFHSDIVTIKLNTTAVDHADAIATVIPSLIKLLDDDDGDDNDNDDDDDRKEEAASAIANLAVHGLSHLSIVEK
jgi:hypothetical protein